MVTIDEIVELPCTLSLTGQTNTPTQLQFFTLLKLLNSNLVSCSLSSIQSIQ